MVGKPAETAAPAEEGKDPAAETGGQAGSAELKTEGAVEKKKDVKEMELAGFRAQCEIHCRKELDARVVSLVAEGTGVEIQATVTSTRLYKNLTEEVPFMGFYDCKNAKLCNVFEGQGARVS